MVARGHDSAANAMAPPAEPQAASQDPDIHILPLPPEADREINALQRAASIVLHKSLKEGFGVAGSEAMWKGKPVIGGTAGGVSAQIVDEATGFIVHSAEGAAFRIRYLLNNRAVMVAVSARGTRSVTFAPIFEKMDVTLLTPEDADHDASLSPDGDASASGATEGPWIR